MQGATDRRAIELRHVSAALGGEAGEPDVHRDRFLSRIWEFRLLDFLQFFDSSPFARTLSGRAPMTISTSALTCSPNAQNAGTFALPTETGGLWFGYQSALSENRGLSTHITALVNIALFSCRVDE